MKQALILTLLTLSSSPAFAYGSHSNLLAEENFECNVRGARGQELNATINRVFLEDKVTKLRSLFSTMVLASDPEHFEHLGSKLERVLGPTFGQPTYDESSLTIALEDVRNEALSTQFAPLPNIAQTKRTAWSQDSQDDLEVALSLRASDTESYAMALRFSKNGRSVNLSGSCRKL
ncbi:MAG: hypothetical protein ACXVB9_13815 [Bdellovibrionota bacterium]